MHFVLTAFNAFIIADDIRFVNLTRLIEKLTYLQENYILGIFKNITNKKRE